METESLCQAAGGMSFLLRVSYTSLNFLRQAGSSACYLTLQYAALMAHTKKYNAIFQKEFKDIRYYFQGPVKAQLLFFIYCLE